MYSICDGGLSLPCMHGDLRPPRVADRIAGGGDPRYQGTSVSYEDPRPDHRGELGRLRTWLLAVEGGVAPAFAKALDFAVAGERVDQQSYPLLGAVRKQFVVDSAGGSSAAPRRASRDHAQQLIRMLTVSGYCDARCSDQELRRLEVRT